VHPEELAPDAPARRMFSLPDTVTAQEGGNVRVPSSLAFGIREREERMLFEHLPLLSADMNTRHKMTMMTNNSLSGGGGGGGGASGHQRKGVEAISAYHETQLAAGVTQANVLAKMVDLRNANAAGIAFENRRRVIEAFSEPGKPNDSGRTEVQGALCRVSAPLSIPLIFILFFIFAFSYVFPSCVNDPSSTQCMEPPPRI
jgi:small subunit ribosomal protein S15